MRVPLGPDARQGFCPKCLFPQIAADPDIADADLASPPATTDTDTGSHRSPSADKAAADTARRFGDYELLEELGRGGMGIVFKARQRSIGRHVALKLLAFGPLASPEVIKRFRMEATAAGALQHPNIVAIHEVGIHQDQHYLVMDYVAGPNLAALAANQPWPAQRSATLVKTIAEAIHYAHERGILHRDLKPSNILVDQDGQPRITDFGLTKRLNTEHRLLNTDHSDSTAGSNQFSVISDQYPDLTLTGQVLGSPNYMPPEQASASKGKVGRYSDVYSLGAVLYHLLTGRPPFVDETITATLHQVLETEAASPRLLNPRVPVDLETICLKCLEKEPERRYGTARELAEELGHFLKGEPILARPINRLQRLWRWCRRNPVVASLNSRRGRVYSVAVSPNGQRIASGNQDGTVSVWSPKDSVEVMTLKGHTGSVFSVAFSLDGRFLVTSGADRTARVWDASSGQPLRVFQGHSDYVRSATFSPDGQRIVTDSDDYSAIVWEAATGRRLLTLNGHSDYVRSAVFAPDGRLVATASDDRTTKLWDAVNGGLLLTLKTTAAPLTSAAFTSGGRNIAVAQTDGTVTQWELDSAEQVASWENEEERSRRRVAQLQRETPEIARGATRASPPGARVDSPVVDAGTHSGFARSPGGQAAG